MKYDEYIKLLKTNHNLILNGAPGTGKTHLAREIAMRMIFGEVKDEKALTGETEEGRIWNECCGFVQFHPSYDYTDFVEGLRPTEPDNDNANVGFKLTDGVFKKFCERAQKNLDDSKKTEEELKKENSLMQILNDFLNDAIVNETEFEYDSRKAGTKSRFFITSHSDSDYFYANMPNSQVYKKQIISKNDVLTALKISDKISKPSDLIDIFKKGRYSGQFTFIFQILERLRKKIKDKTIEPIKKVDVKPFIFIIDEINRGEVSKIFGELFFSIDPGYRGEKGKVLTQYANMQTEPNVFDNALNISGAFDKAQYGHFFVPKNVYIIGTMNDIDRSVESMDFAMRRRFVFKEITAEESAENMGLPEETKARMKALNDAISGIDGLGSSYHIGGSYFLNETDLDKLWNLRLKPLIQEYLRGTGFDKKLEDLENKDGKAGTFEAGVRYLTKIGKGE